MTSANDKVEDAITDLISAKEKIKELEEDVKQLAQRSNRFEVEASQLRERLVLNNEGMDEVKETLEQALEVAHSLAEHQADEIESLKAKTAAGLAVNKSLVAEVKSISEDRDMWKQSWDNSHKAFSDLQDVILGKDSVTETYDDLLAPVQDLVNLKLFIKYHLGIASNQDCSVRKLQHELSKVLRPRSTEERDSILSQIREVLGARSRLSDKGYETALQAAKRVMEQRSDLLTLFKAASVGAGTYYPHDPKGLTEFLEKKVREKESYSCEKGTGARTYTPPEGYIVVKEDLLKQTITETIQNTVRACGEEFIRKLI